MREIRYICTFLLPLVFLQLCKPFLATLLGFHKGTIPYFTMALGVLFIVFFAVYLYKYHRDWLMIGINVIVILALMEGVFYYLNHKKPKPLYDFKFSFTDAKGDKAGNLYDHDTMYGYKMYPDITTRVDLTYKDSVLRTAYYHTDSFGKRYTPFAIEGLNTGDKKYSLFFGCSFAFGCYVNDSETLEYDLGKEDTNFISYNFGVNGWGPQGMLVQLQHPADIKKQLAGDTTAGRAFYIYIEHHVRRAIGDMDYLMNFDPHTPCFKIDKGKLENKGSFLDAHPTRYKIFKLLSKSNTLKYFGFNYPKRLRKQDYELTARIIVEAFNNYKKDFGNDNFYVVIYPHQDNTILKYLAGTGVKTIDLSGLFNPLIKPELMVAGDGHPTAIAYKLVAEKLEDSLRLNRFTLH